MAGSITLSMVVAMDQAHAIGIEGHMPWHLPDDLRWFKQVTLGKPVLMGHATAISIGRSLPGRLNLVLSRRKGAAPFDGQQRVSSLEEALEVCRDAGAAELMVIGGGQVYAQCIERADRLYISHIKTKVDEADTWFPEFEWHQWREVSRQPHPADAQHVFAFDMITLERVQASV